MRQQLFDDHFVQLLSYTSELSNYATRIPKSAQFFSCSAHHRRYAHIFFPKDVVACPISLAFAARHSYYIGYSSELPRRLCTVLCHILPGEIV